MNITEANAVNTLLRWVTGYTRPHTHRSPVTPDEAREAAELLAGRAYRALSAGMDARDVAEHWPTERGGRREPDSEEERQDVMAASYPEGTDPASAAAEAEAAHEEHREAEIREAEIRADERRKLAAEYRSIADDPVPLREWMQAHGLNLERTASTARVLSAVAGDIGSRLGGYAVPRCRHTSATPWGPSQCALPDGHLGRHAVVPSEASDDKEEAHG